MNRLLFTKIMRLKPATDLMYLKEKQLIKLKEKLYKLIVAIEFELQCLKEN